VAAVKPVEQTQMRPGGGGNCVAACVASIFEVPLSDCWPEIPNGGGFQYVCNWTARRFPGLQVSGKNVAPPVEVKRGNFTRWIDVPVPVQVLTAPVYGCYWIASAVSPRAAMQKMADDEYRPSLHCVVMRGSEVVWDPHPKREMGIGGVVSGLWWIAADPALL
jgi:hypothetical protein